MILTFHSIERKPLTEFISNDEEHTHWIFTFPCKHVLKNDKRKTIRKI